MNLQSKTTTVPSHLADGKVTWKSPSNIALVKYWGKHGVQLPRNPSLSLTLKKATTTTSIVYQPRTNFKEEFSYDFFFEQKRNKLFGQRIARYFANLVQDLPFIRQLHFRIDSANSFPHSAGIASSASAFSALALCLSTIEDRLYGPRDDDNFIQRTSALARKGSGSACRSVYAGAALWGETPLVRESSDLYAVSMEAQLHATFKSYRDSILLLGTEEKKVSSSAGHSMMDSHPFAAVRYVEANKNLSRILPCLRKGDWQQFGEICEMEAMQLHALMLCSTPNYILLAPNTIKCIKLVQIFREEMKIPISFTLDAGPNLHLLYPSEYKDTVQNFIQQQLAGLCEDQKWIDDEVGSGPELLQNKEA